MTKTGIKWKRVENDGMGVVSNQNKTGLTRGQAQFKGKNEGDRIT
jgi:hypothetical protein